MRSEVGKIRLVILIALLFSALCAAVFRTTPILFMAALLGSAPFIGFLFTRLSNRSLKIIQTLPETGTVGELLTGKITLVNRSRFPSFFIHVRPGTDSVSKAKPSLFSRWKVLLPPTITPQTPEWIVPYLGGREQASYQSQWQLKRRGIHELSPTRAGVADPLALTLGTPVQSGTNRIVVLPRPLQVDQLGFLSEIGATSQTPHHSAMVANAMDFHGVRPWIPGEAIRRAHWKSTARTGQLHIIEWEDTPTADLAIFIDTHAGTLVGDDEENSLEWSITAAATVICHLLENGSRVQLFYFSSGSDSSSQEETVVLHTPQERSANGRMRMLRALAEIEAVQGPGSDLPALVEAALPKVMPGLGVLLLTSASAPFAQAQMQIQAGVSYSSCYALAFDVETETETEAGTEAEGKGESEEALTPPILPKAPRIWHHTSPPIGRGMSQIVYGRKALAAVLEGSP